ncbi:MAG: SGNH/GDSL hydrolase family protein [Candidatus Hydrogenedentes bacterium]|nr:SGNH/GDSL hydrolase family protein [Candidatus Hydrogenedentota bacterium]
MSDLANESRTRRTSAPRIAVLALASAVLIGGALGYYHYYLSRPIGSGPAGPSVPLEPFQKTWGDGPVVLLGLGDSVTAGYGASPGLSYVERLAKNPPDEFADMQGRSLAAVFPMLTLRNESVSGSTSIDCIESQIPRLSPFDANTRGVVVVTTGGNDLIHMYGRIPPREGAMYGATMEQAKPWIANFESRMHTILERITALFPGGCHIFLATIYDPTDGSADAPAAGLPQWPDGVAILAEYNRIIKACAEKYSNVHVVDMHEAFLGHGVHCARPWKPHYRSDDPHYWYYDNLEDPNDRGYDAIRRLFLMEMVEVYAQGTQRT